MLAVLHSRTGKSRELRETTTTSGRHNLARVGLEHSVLFAPFSSWPYTVRRCSVTLAFPTVESILLEQSGELQLCSCVGGERSNSTVMNG